MYSSAKIGVESNGVRLCVCAFLVLCEMKFMSRKPRIHFPEAVAISSAEGRRRKYQITKA
jgi:hypothetical protein